MLATIDWIKKNYNDFNARYFNNELPKNLVFKLSKSKTTWGYAEFMYDFKNSVIIPLSITLSNYYDSPERVKQNTLLHEMIHVLDYIMNPNHFIINGRKVSKRHYDAHGYWFMEQVNRLNKFGWEVSKYITPDEINQSTLSPSAKRKEEKYLNDGIVCVITGDRYSWMIKTNTTNIHTLLNTVNRISWCSVLGHVKSIKTYTFNDVYLASVRNSSRSCRGWKYTKQTLLNRLESIKATEIHDYQGEINTIMRKYIDAA